jgi:hypothetical protein
MHQWTKAAIVLLLLTAYCDGAPPLVRLSTEPPFAATLDSIDGDGNITFRTGDKLRVVASRELACWGRYCDVSGGPQFLLQDGSAIRADLLKLDETSLVVGDATGLGHGPWEQSTIPRSALRAIVWQPPAGTLDRDLLLHELSQGGRTADRLLLVGGELLTGRLLAAPLDGPFAPENAVASQATFSWQSAGQAEPLAVPSAKVRAAALAGSGFAAASPSPRPARPTLWIGCRDGSLVQATGVSVLNAKVSIKLAAGGELVTSLAHRSEEGATFFSEVAWLHSSGGDCHWLSDLKTLGYKHIPYLSVDWPYHGDRSSAGGRLRAVGTVGPKGLGMHATSRLAYDVAGYRKFEAELAIDESSLRRGNAIFKVLLQDGQGAWQSAYESPVVRGGEAPVPVSIDLKGAERLALIVEFADRGDELDQANWLGARLLK